MANIFGKSPGEYSHIDARESLRPGTIVEIRNRDSVNEYNVSFPSSRSAVPSFVSQNESVIQRAMQAEIDDIWHQYFRVDDLVPITRFTPVDGENQGDPERYHHTIDSEDDTAYVDVETYTKSIVYTYDAIWDSIFEHNRIDPDAIRRAAQNAVQKLYDVAVNGITDDDDNQIAVGLIGLPDSPTDDPRVISTEGMITTVNFNDFIDSANDVLGNLMEIKVNVLTPKNIDPNLKGFIDQWLEDRNETPKTVAIEELNDAADGGNPRVIVLINHSDIIEFPFVIINPGEESNPFDAQARAEIELEDDHISISVTQKYTPLVVKEHGAIIYLNDPTTIAADPETENGDESVSSGNITGIDAGTGIRVDDGDTASPEVNISDGGVDTTQLASDAVTTAKIGADAVTGAKINDDAVGTEHIAADAIETAHVGDLQITADKLAENAVTGAKVADDAINSEHIVDGAVDTDELASDAVTNAKLASDISADKITDGTLSADRIHADIARLDDPDLTGTPTAPTADANDSSTQIATTEYVQSEISGFGTGDVTGIDAGTGIRIDAGGTATPEVNVSDGGVGSTQLASDAVTTVKLGADAVTGAKINDDAVGTEHIANEAVTPEKISDSAPEILVGWTAMSTGPASFTEFTRSDDSTVFHNTVWASIPTTSSAAYLWYVLPDTHPIPREIYWGSSPNIASAFQTTSMNAMDNSAPVDAYRTANRQISGLSQEIMRLVF